MSQQRILLFGATGMAGHVAYHYLSQTGRYAVTDVAFRRPLTPQGRTVNVCDADAVARLVREMRPDVILNCVGVLIRGSHDDPANAIYINAYFPHQLAQLADETGAKLVHLSTDCVFSGKKGNYTEEDFRDADDVYGRSKALGEIVSDRHLTLRTSIIGPEIKRAGEGLFHWFMQQKESCMGFRTAIWGGVTTLELAKVIDFALQNDLTGLVHVSNGEGIDKDTLLRLIQRIWQKDIDIQAVPRNGVDKSIARSSRLSYEVPGYEAMLREQYAWMQAHPELYAALYPQQA